MTGRSSRDECGPRRASAGRPKGVNEVSVRQEPETGVQQSEREREFAVCFSVSFNHEIS